LNPNQCLQKCFDPVARITAAFAGVGMVQGVLPVTVRSGFIRVEGNADSRHHIPEQRQPATNPTA